MLPENAQRTPELHKALRKKILFWVGAWYVVLFTSIISVSFTAPLRAGENIPLVATLTFIPTLLLSRKLLRRATSLFSINAGSETIPTIDGPDQHLPSVACALALFIPTQPQYIVKNLRAIIYVTIFLGCAPIWSLMTATIFAINKYGDHAPAQRVSSKIDNKYASLRRNGGLHYNIEFDSPALPIFPFTGNYREVTSVLPENYHRIVIGQSTINMDIYPGALSMPWRSWTNETFDKLSAP